MVEKKYFKIVEIISPRLGFRDSAEDFLKKINSLPGEIIIDFNGVEFISRSFAHEYLMQTLRNNSINTINVPKNVQFRFNTVLSSIKNPKKTKVNAKRILAFA